MSLSPPSWSHRLIRDIDFASAIGITYAPHRRPSYHKPPPPPFPYHPRPPDGGAASTSRQAGLAVIEQRPSTEACFCLAPVPLRLGSRQLRHCMRRALRNTSSHTRYARVSALAAPPASTRLLAFSVLSLRSPERAALFLEPGEGGAADELGKDHEVLSVLSCLSRRRIESQTVSKLVSWIWAC